MAKRTFFEVGLLVAAGCGSVMSAPDAGGPPADSPRAGSDAPATTIDAPATANDAPADGPACVPQCSSDTLVACGSNGSAITTDCDLGCNPNGGSGSDTPECNILTPSNLTSFPKLCDAPVGSDFTFTGTTTINTGVSGTCTHIQVQSGGAPSICVIVYDSINIEAGAKIKVVGPDALALVATAQMTIGGTIDASADGSNVPGPGSPFAAGVGAAGASFLASGGGGGAGGSTSGGSGGFVSHGGSGGSATGTPMLVPLIGGAVGGTGAIDPNTAGTNTPAPGGLGGGALELVSCHSVSLLAGSIIDVSGAGGRGGQGSIVFAASTFGGGGGGGGGGGMVVVEGVAVTLAGLVSSNGGAGGGGGGNGPSKTVAGTAGEPGADGAASTQPAVGGSGGPEASSLSGAAGGGGATGTVAPTDGNFDEQDNGAAGGGGGASGRVRVNVRSGTNATNNGTISAAMSQGAVATHTK